MAYILLGCLGFIITHTFDFVALSGVRKIKPFIWFIGNALIVYSIVSIIVSPGKLLLPLWSFWLGWILIPLPLFFQLYTLFGNLPLRKTYVDSGVGDKLVKTGLFALARHPGVMFFVPLMVGLTLTSKSTLMVFATVVFSVLDVILVIIQDIYFFPRMFKGYDDYKKETPSILPTINSIKACIKTFNTNRTPIIKEVKMKTITSSTEWTSGYKSEEIWQRYCSYIDLSLVDFMKIQKRLLLEQLELLNRCKLGNKIMRGNKIYSIDEFRKRVPLTTYMDYEQYFSRRIKSVLPEKPITWMHTSGRSGEFTKWIPVTERRFREMGFLCIAALIFSTCNKHGDVNLKPNDKWLYALAPPPYMSGTWARGVEEELPLMIIPSLDEAERLSFSERTQKGLKIALEKGIDLCGGMPSVLLAMGEQLAENNNGNTSLSYLLKHPQVLSRMAGGILKSRLANRKILPRDLWKLKGILAGGADTAVFRERIKHMWGIYPLDIYAFTEAGIISTQTWDYKGMTFVPSLNFLEFIPESESIKSRQNPGYNPLTLLLDELQPEQNYELVITNLLGGPMIRYRVGDIIRITSLRNEKLNLDIPQMAFYSRSDNIIDIAGFTRLTEKTIWQAIENSGVDYKEWTARKEGGEHPVLRIYMELKHNGYKKEELTANIHQRLIELDRDYADLESILKMRPVDVIILPGGAFTNYATQQQSSGAGIGKIKPPHINPSEVVLNNLTKANDKMSVSLLQEQREEVISR